MKRKAWVEISLGGVEESDSFRGRGEENRRAENRLQAPNRAAKVGAAS